MRLLFALNTFRPHIDGVAISIERQATGLSRRGHAVAIVAPSPSLSDYVESVHGCRIYRRRAVPAAGPHRRVPLFPKVGVARAIDDFQPDVVIVSQPFLLSRAAWAVARERSLPLVGITSMMPEWFYYNVRSLQPFARALDGLLWRTITRFYNRCNHVVGVSATALGFLKEHGLHRPCAVISNGVDREVFRPRPYDYALSARLGLPAKPTVLYAGRLDAEKCMDVWLRAAALVRRQIDAHFIVGGEGSERRSLERLTKQLGLDQSVSFIGYLSDLDYPRLYSVADVFAITSPAELQSIVSLEALASSLPIVAARAGALPELVRAGENGYLVRPGDPSSLADALVRILGDAERRTAMGVVSREVAGAHDFEHTLDVYEQVYHSVIAQPSPIPFVRSGDLERAASA